VRGLGVRPLSAGFAERWNRKRRFELDADFLFGILQNTQARQIASTDPSLEVNSIQTGLFRNRRAQSLAALLY
jgi:hypothetical protein